MRGKEKQISSLLILLLIVGGFILSTRKAILFSEDPISCRRTNNRFIRKKYCGKE